MSNDNAVIASPSSSPYRRASIAFFFASSGFAFANWAVRIPDIRDALHLKITEIGLLLLCPVIGAFTLTIFSSFLIMRFGSRLTTRCGAYLILLALLFIGFATNRLWLGCALMVFGSGMGIMNISINDQAASLERRYRRSIMASFHGVYSLGGMLGALAASLLVSLHLKPAFHLTLITLLLLIGTITSQRLLIKREPSEAYHRGPLFILPHGQLWWVGIIAAAAVFIEGVMVDWSSLFLVTLGAKKNFAGLGLAFFTGAMAIGRLLGDYWIEKIGPLNTIQIGGILSLFGLALAIFIGQPIIILVGFTLTGFGVSALFPCLLSLAGRNKSMAPSQAIASVAMMGYLSLLAGPPLLGFLSHLIGLHWAFSALLISSIIIYLMAKPATR